MALFSGQRFGWSTDGASVIYSRVDPGSKWNVYRVRVSGSAAPEPLVTGPGDRFLALVPERDGLGAVTGVQSWRAALPDSKR